ncbi:MAG: shikimate dehydrogenase [Thermodesulfobacteriota bacterium]
MIDSRTQLYGVIGNPVRHSLSPIIHNFMFRKMGLNSVYLAFEARDISKTLIGIRALGIRGLSVTIPFKTEVIPFLDKVDEVAEKIKAVNTIINEGGGLIGYNTDWLGAIKALEERVKLRNKKVLLLGAGGGARAIAFGLKERGCEVLISNRTKDKGKRLAQEFGFMAISSFEDIDVDILINATSVGMSPDDRESPFPKRFLKEGMTVMDIVYHPLNTKLLQEARQRGCKTIDGLQMLIHQAIAQFEIWTKRKLEVKKVKKDLFKLISSYLKSDKEELFKKL